MNRRQALRTGLSVAAAAVALRSELSAGQGAVTTAAIAGDTLYVSPAAGSDTNAGGHEAPLRTLAEAARRVNASTGSGPVTVVLAEGIHAIGETTLLGPKGRTFSRTDRLTIRAEILPDDPDWHIGRMPTLIHTMPLSSTWNGRPDPLGSAADGMLIETSHVTVRGLRILGLPVIESPRPGVIKRLYGISRFDRALDDLEIAQCILAGEDSTSIASDFVYRNNGSVLSHTCEHDRDRPARRSRRRPDEDRLPAPGCRISGGQNRGGAVHEAEGLISLPAERAPQRGENGDVTTADFL